MTLDIATAVNLLGQAETGEISFRCGLAAVAEATGAQRCTHAFLDKAGGFQQDSWPFDMDGLLLYNEQYVHRDVRFTRVLQTNFQGLATTLHFMRPEEIAKCPVHQEFYRQYPECWNTTFFVTATSHGIAVTTIHRSPERGWFDADEQAVFRTLAPHIVRCERQIIPSGQLQTEGVALAFEALPDASFIINPLGEVVHLNGAARKMVMDGDVLALLSGSLVAIHRGSRHPLNALIRQAIEHLRDVGAILPRSVVVVGAKERRTVRVSCFVTPPGAGQRLVVLQAVDVASIGLPSAESIARVTGLSPAEARLCARLVAGATIRKCAEETGLSEHTLRTQMRSIREKMAVATQTEALVEVVRLCSA